MLRRPARLNLGPQTVWSRYAHTLTAWPDTSDESNADRSYADRRGASQFEDMPHRRAAHDRWILEHPARAAFGEAWADRNLDELVEILNNSRRDGAGPEITPVD